MSANATHARLALVTASVEPSSLAARIVELVAGHRPELVALVDRELDRQLETLVAERIAARNGNGDRPSTAAAAPTEPSYGSATKPCAVCGVDKPADQYEAGRRTCRECRRRQVRERAARRGSEGDRASIS